MSEPRRFRDRDTMLGAAFRAADDDAPPASAKKALLVALGASTVAATTTTKATVVSSAAARVASAFAKAAFATKTVIATTVIVATGATATVAVENETRTSAPVATLATPRTIASTSFRIAMAPPPVPTTMTTATPVAPSTAAVVAPPPPRPTAVAPKPRVQEEIAELESVRIALTLGRAHDALSSLERYRVKHPTGVMTEEARVLEIEALAKSGDGVRARELGAAFLRERSASPLAPRVRRVVDAR